MAAASITSKSEDCLLISYLHHIRFSWLGFIQRDQVPDAKLKDVHEDQRDEDKGVYPHKILRQREVLVFLFLWRRRPAFRRPAASLVL